MVKSEEVVDDEWLLEQCLKGKTGYWNVLVHRYQPQLVEQVSRSIPKLEDASEVVEIALCNALNSLGSFRTHMEVPQSRFVNWLRTFLAEPAISKLRQPKGPSTQS